jgi:hypothetical protein
MNPPDAYLELEERIEQLEEAILRSRKLTQASRFVVVAGAALLVGCFSGLLARNDLALILGIALSIGGLVLGGSSRQTTAELRSALADAQARRNAMIDELPLVDVSPHAGA